MRRGSPGKGLSRIDFAGDALLRGERSCSAGPSRTSCATRSATPRRARPSRSGSEAGRRRPCRRPRLRARRSEELLGSIFEPFFRVEGHRSRASGGVGLGLAIARRAVDLHRGRIVAHNAGPGLKVTIVLPLANVALVTS